jgi:hypothetical protein
MMGEMMIGKCPICNTENVQLDRTYFRYKGINCECCNNNEHFILREHCKNCTPIEPDYTKVEFRTEDLKNPVKIAMDILKNALLEDDSAGSYYHSWQSNISCAIMDKCKGVNIEDANDAAILFLNKLIK